jgi:hypothetical protein
LRKYWLFPKKPLDFQLVHAHRDAFGHRACRRQSLRLSDQAPFAHKFISTQDCDYGFLALRGNYGDFDFAFFNIENGVSVITLRKDDFIFRCFEMLRPLAAVSKNKAGSNRRRAPAVLGFSLHSFISPPCQSAV